MAFFCCLDTYVSQRVFLYNFAYFVVFLGVGVMANREVMQALNTLAHFNNMTNGSLFGAGFGQVSHTQRGSMMLNCVPDPADSYHFYGILSNIEDGPGFKKKSEIRYFS